MALSLAPKAGAHGPVAGAHGPAPGAQRAHAPARFSLSLMGCFLN